MNELEEKIIKLEKELQQLMLISQNLRNEVYSLRLRLKEIQGFDI